MKKRFLLATMAMVVVGFGGYGYGLHGEDSYRDVMDTGISSEEAFEISEDEILVTESVIVESVSEAVESIELENLEEVTELVVAAEESERPEDVIAMEGPAEPVTEEPVTDKTTESVPETVVETNTEVTTEASEEASQEAVEITTETPTEDSEVDVFVAYDPNYVVTLAVEKTKAYGKVLVWENLDRLLAEGKITQEEYDEYYPYDGLENSYYSVFVETDLSKASTVSGTSLGSEEAIADYIAEMLALETGPYFAISYAGIYEGTYGVFYEFRCHR